MGFNKVIERSYIISSKNHKFFADRDFYRNCTTMSCMLSPIVSCRWVETVFNKVICYEERCCKPHEQMATVISPPLSFAFYTFLSWHPFLLKFSPYFLFPSTHFNFIFSSCCFNIVRWLSSHTYFLQTTAFFLFQFPTSRSKTIFSLVLFHESFALLGVLSLLLAEAWGRMSH